MLILNVTQSVVGAGGINFPTGKVIDLSTYGLGQAALYSIALKMVGNTPLSPMDADAAALSGLVSPSNYPGVTGGVPPTAVAISGTKNGSNADFTIPVAPSSWCAVYLNGARLKEGVGFTRIGLHITALVGYFPQSGDSYEADYI